ncbi:hypothetical protein [Dysgonomonas sp. GY617]|uniref:hypothetical protein n=1 Tax=Dysgonomonas sp. GY617 TaxID=2780420 RepID=UPI0018840CE3|nr:hypothetical protein [Dysgonomonas sp. GY617]MBF0575584.1 hypothetical protein [Dysgonomonas sp. GY617]
MKYIYIIILIFSITDSLFGQVGINIANNSLKGVFHIDSKGDTYGSSNTSDDIVVLANGNIGIGTITPTQTLEVNTEGRPIRIDDGSAAKNFILTSDDNGVGTWKPKNIGDRVEGFVSALNQKNGVGLGTTFKYSGAYITIPPGQWEIHFVSTHSNISGYNYCIWWDLDDSSTVKNSIPVGGRVLSYMAESGGLIQTSAMYFVNNNTSTNKDYYIWGCILVLPSTIIGDYINYYNNAFLWAIPVNS